jgi:hypothetical protein
MNILTQFFDDTVTDDDFWNIGTEVFIASLIGMLLALALYVVVTL